MKTVKRTSIFPASREVVFKKLQQLETLQFIAYPYATFTPANPNGSCIWRPGTSSSYRFRIWGIIPLGVHTINIEKFDIDGIASKEGNVFVPVWNHKIRLKALGNRTEYTDEVDIDAGWKTLFVWLWAKAFYAHRQKRWISLLKNAALSHPASWARKALAFAEQVDRSLPAGILPYRYL